MYPKLHVSNNKPPVGLLLRLAVPIILAVLMLIYPEKIFPAAKRGIDTWWQVVFPGLFPFFIISELMIRLGIVHFLSVFLEPVMRPLFNVPGSGALVLAAGYTSGAPIGGVMTSTLEQQNLINKEEASRLVAFTNNASPLFMLSSIAVGFLGLPQVGWLLAGSHYAANFFVGIILKKLSVKKEYLFHTYSIKQLFFLGMRKMEQASTDARQPLGHILGDATRKAMQNILVVGGFIIIFSVLIEIMSIVGLLTFVGNILGLVLLPLGVDQTLLVPLASGLLEMTIGIKMIAESNVPLVQQLVCISLLLGWAGLAVHAQVAAFISERNISLAPYFLARLLQSLFAAVFTLALGYSLLPNLVLDVIAPAQLASWLIALNSLKTMFLLLLFLLIANFTILLWRRLLSHI